MNDLDLSSLATGPAPVLAPPSAVRARGEQRTRRTRVSVAGAAGLVVVASAGAAIALSSSGKHDSLQIAGTPTPGTSPVPTDLEPPKPRLRAAVLTPADLTAVVGGTWVGDVALGDGQAGLTPCRDQFTRSTWGMSGGYTRTAGSGLVQVQALEFSSDEAARTALDKVHADVLRCPGHAFTRPYPRAEGGQAHNVLVDVGPQALGVAQTSIVCSESCAPWTGYWVVARVENLLGYVLVTDEAHLRGYADALHARLAAAVASYPR